MTLLATARALDDQRFLWRVRAAMLNTAVTKYSSADVEDKALAEYVLDNPMQANKTMEALVAAKDTVTAVVTVDTSSTVNTEAVTDASISTAVNTYWASVAQRRAELVALNLV